jgi:hypothetical protein
MNTPTEGSSEPLTGTPSSGSETGTPVIASRRGPSSQSLRWKAAAAELVPEKSLARVAANAKYVVATVTVVGTGLTALGLVGANTLATHPAARLLAVAAVVLAGAAVALALSSLVLRSKPVNLENLSAVKEWYTEEFGRAKFVRWAGILLVLGVVVALIAGLTAVLIPDPRATAGVQVARSGLTRTASVTVMANGLNPDAAATLWVYGIPSSGPSTTLLAATESTDTAGSLSLKATIDKVAPYSRYCVVLRIGKKELARAEIAGIP